MSTVEKGPIDYSSYQHLLVEKKGGIATVILNRPEVLNAVNSRMHQELGRIWLDLDQDDEVKVAIVTGAGDAFSAGGDFEMLEGMIASHQRLIEGMKEAQAIVLNMINMEKPTISAINGWAVGAGLAVALLADLSIASEKAKFKDGHTRLGVAAGDHAAIIWPLLIGMAKSKRYLLTNEVLDGKEAERIGLVGMVVPHKQLMPRAMEEAQKLAMGPKDAIRFNKRSLNDWIRAAGPIFEHSLALETINFSGDDIKEGLKSLQEKRPPKFPSAS